MTTVELDSLRKKVIDDYWQNYSQYISLMYKFFPYLLTNSFDDFKKMHADEDDLDLAWKMLQINKENYIEPTYIMNVFYDYVYLKKKKYIRL